LNPSQILGLDRGKLTAGSFADVMIISDQTSWVVNKQTLVSKSKNSAFLGRSLPGVVDYTICNGAVVYQR
jgi:dihydroorotase